MPQMFEVQYRVNKMLLGNRQNVTTEAQTLLSIFSISDTIKSQIKTIVLTNFSNNDIYYGVDASVSTSNAGGMIYPKAKLEIALVDVNWSPYFIAEASSAMGIELWG